MPREAGGGTTVIITGIEEIDRRLKTLSNRVRNKIVRAAMRKGMKLVQGRVQAKAPVDTGKLKRAVKVRALDAKYRRRGDLGIEVRIGEGDFKGDTFYAAFQEYGTRKMSGRHFMEAAYAEEGESARRITVNELLKKTLEEANKS